MSKSTKISLPNVTIEKYTFTDITGDEYTTYFIYINGVFHEIRRSKQEVIDYLNVMILGEVL